MNTPYIRPLFSLFAVVLSLQLSLLPPIMTIVQQYYHAGSPMAMNCDMKKCSLKKRAGASCPMHAAESDRHHAAQHSICGCSHGTDTDGLMASTSTVLKAILSSGRAVTPPGGTADYPAYRSDFPSGPYFPVFRPPG